MTWIIFSTITNIIGHTVVEITHYLRNPLQKTKQKTVMSKVQLIHLNPQQQQKIIIILHNLLATVSWEKPISLSLCAIVNCVLNFLTCLLKMNNIDMECVIIVVLKK